MPPIRDLSSLLTTYAKAWMLFLPPLSTAPGAELCHSLPQQEATTNELLMIVLQTTCHDVDGAGSLVRDQHRSPSTSRPGVLPGYNTDHLSVDGLHSTEMAGVSIPDIPLLDSAQNAIVRDLQPPSY
jgi:hypothetical protein